MHTDYGGQSMVAEAGLGGGGGQSGGETREMNAMLPGAWRVYVRSVVFLLAVLLTVGAVGHVIPETLPWMLALTPGFSLLAGALVVVPAVAAGGGRFVGWAAAAYGFIFLTEAAGVATGAIYGDCAYGPTLGWTWRGVPLIIAFNWMLVINGAVCLAGRIAAPLAGARRWLAIATLAGLITALFDFCMEPVAIRLDYWHWAGGAIPLRNYAAWFGVAAAAAAVHPRQIWPSSCDIGTTRRLAGIYVAMQAVFFLALCAVWRWQGS